jgi:hypothetical protein
VRVRVAAHCPRGYNHRGKDATGEPLKATFPPGWEGDVAYDARVQQAIDLGVIEERPKVKET